VGYVLSKIDGKKAGAIEDVVENIPSVTDADRLFIVTDGNLWGESEGGAKILLGANEERSLFRGVVYSDDPRLCEGVRRADNVIAVTRTPEAKRIQQIKDFFDTGRKPDEFERSESTRRLSLAIHGVENLAFPIRTDAGFLCENKADLDEVFGDNLGHNGYLTRNRSFENGNGIESQIAHFLAPLVGLKAVALGEFLTEGKVDPEKIEVGLKIRAAREAGRSMKSGAKDAEKLREQLECVSNSLGDLVNALRKVRDAEEKRKEQAQ
jgi:hypothetical protein